MHCYFVILTYYYRIVVLYLSIIIIYFSCSINVFVDAWFVVLLYYIIVLWSCSCSWWRPWRQTFRINWYVLESTISTKKKTVLLRPKNPRRKLKNVCDVDKKSDWSKASSSLHPSNVLMMHFHSENFVSVNHRYDTWQDHLLLTWLHDALSTRPSSTM